MERIELKLHERERMLAALDEMIQRYEAVTIEQLYSMFAEHESAERIMKQLTGYSNALHCSICKTNKSIQDERIAASTEPMGDMQVLSSLCSYCATFAVTRVWCSDDATYIAIRLSDTPGKLLSSVRARIDRLKNIRARFIESFLQTDKNDKK